MNKPNHLGLAGLELSKILVAELFYGYVKSKYGEKVKLFYMDRDKKKHLIKNLKFENYKNCLEATQLDNIIK